MELYQRDGTQEKRGRTGPGKTPVPDVDSSGLHKIFPAPSIHADSRTSMPQTAPRIYLIHASYPQHERLYPHRFP